MRLDNLSSNLATLKKDKVFKELTVSLTNGKKNYLRFLK